MIHSNLYFIFNNYFESHFSTGNGVVIHIPQFFDELEALEAKGNSYTHALLPLYHLTCSAVPETLQKKQ